MKIDKAQAPANAPVTATRFERIDTPAGPIVLCNPTRAQLRRWRKGIEGGAAADAYETLFIDTCLVPDSANVNAMLDEWPGVSNNSEVVAAMNRLAGLTNDDALKA